jgi:hypothetical protein
MMWISLIKSSEGLNRNFSTKCQNRIGFKFGLCIYLSVWIITFSVNIRLQWNWWCWKDNKKWNNYIRNSFSQIRRFTMPKFPHNKRPQFWTNLESFSYLNWSFNLLLGQEDSRDDFSGIPRASKPLLVFINRPLSFKRRVLGLVLKFRQKIFLDGLTSWRREEHGRRPSQHYDERLNS